MLPAGGCCWLPLAHKSSVGEPWNGQAQQDRHGPTTPLSSLQHSQAPLHFTSTPHRHCMLLIHTSRRSSSHPPPSLTTHRTSPTTMGDAAEWETSKENVMPLKHGRNVAKLNAALAEK